MLKRFEIDDATFDYMIARSGIIGRQILRLCRFIRAADRPEAGSAAGIEKSGRRKRRLRQMFLIRWIGRMAVLFYTYYVGGSLTRSDQITFAKLLRMNGEAYRLTLFNALFCGIPCAAGYFLLGEGFSLLKKVHSYAELPSLMAQHTSLAIGTISLLVDLFRAGDSAWHRRCWAPFGFLPMIINFPTYLKRLSLRHPPVFQPIPISTLRKVSEEEKAEERPAGGPRPSDYDRSRSPEKSMQIPAA